MSEVIKSGEKTEKCLIDKENISDSRRAFLWRAGWIGFFSITAVWLAATVRFFFPRALFEPSPIFKAGYPQTFEVGEINTRFQQSHSVWIIRSDEGFYALLAWCTHLGCTPFWDAEAQKFKCPCHGSGFTKEGLHYEGPAPRPLERLKVSLAPDGQILIDKSTKFRHERGEWSNPGAFLKI